MSFTYINMTISSFGTIYGAYTNSNDDSYTVAFIVLVMDAILVSEMCKKALNRLPQNEDSSKKFLLKVINWVLVSAILFSLAFQLRTFVTGAVIIFSVAIASSAFLFHVYFIYDARRNHSSGSTDKSSSSPFFCTEDDHNNKLATSILQKV